MKRRQGWSMGRGWIRFVVVVGAVGAAVGWSAGRTVGPMEQPAVSWRVSAAVTDRIAPVLTAVLDSPLATPEATPSPVAYPLEPLPLPTRTPLPVDYVPPATPTVDRITPAAPARAQRDSAPGLSPRVWLYVGFVAALLVLAAGMLEVVGRDHAGGGERRDPEPGNDRV